VVSQQTDSLHAAPPPAAPETGLVSEELLHRSLRSNVELAEALAGIVREMNLGLGSILSQVDVLAASRDDPREKRQVAAAIQQEATRLKRVVADLGNATEAASESAPGRGAPPAAPVSRPVVPPPARAAAPSSASQAIPTSASQSIPTSASVITPAPRAARPAESAGASGFHGLLREILGGVHDALTAQDLSVDLRVPTTTGLPSCPPGTLREALTGAVAGLVTVARPGTQLSLRCERKPVLLKGRDGEVKRDFLMLALAHTGSLSPEDQQRVMAGTDPGPLGQATRLFREMGGFVRFAPLPGGAVETRVFLPVA
jgi:hypothetical protein